MVLNLNSQGNYLKTEIALGYSLEKDLDLLLKYEVQIRDSIIGILRSKSIEEIMPVENTGPLKGEILTETNKCLGEQVVTDVYFINFIVQ
jgi:flagellar FliL protein